MRYSFRVEQFSYLFCIITGIISLVAIGVAFHKRDQDVKTAEALAREFENLDLTLHTTNITVPTIVLLVCTGLLVLSSALFLFFSFLPKSIPTFIHPTERNDSRLIQVIAHFAMAVFVIWGVATMIVVTVRAFEDQIVISNVDKEGKAVNVAQVTQDAALKGIYVNYWHYSWIHFLAIGPWFMVLAAIISCAATFEPFNRFRSGSKRSPTDGRSGEESTDNNAGQQLRGPYQRNDNTTNLPGNGSPTEHPPSGNSNDIELNTITSPESADPAIHPTAVVSDTQPSGSKTHAQESTPEDPGTEILP